jgi:hypothetical protein
MASPIRRRDVSSRSGQEHLVLARKIVEAFDCRVLSGDGSVHRTKSQRTSSQKPAQNPIANNQTLRRKDIIAKRNDSGFRSLANFPAILISTGDLSS